jgi:hypothetical protein
MEQLTSSIYARPELGGRPDDVADARAVPRCREWLRPQSVFWTTTNRTASVSCGRQRIILPGTACSTRRSTATLGLITTRPRSRRAPSTRRRSRRA